MEPQSSTELTRQAIALKKAGDAPSAVPLLVQALAATPNFEAAWLWLAVCLSVPAEQRYCLEQALSANPESQQARVGLVRFDHVPSVRPVALSPETIAAPSDSAVGEITAADTALIQCPLCGAMTAPGRFCTECGRNMDTQVNPVLLVEAEATKPCPFCAEPIKAAAIVCRFCGRDLLPTTIPTDTSNRLPITPIAPLVNPVTNPPELVSPPIRAKQSSSVTPILLLLVVLGCAVLWFMGAFRSNSSGGGSAASAVDRGADNISAFVMCKQFVTDRLKAPSTAVFPSSVDDGVTITRLDTAQFKVIAYVDSQNGFGAMIRTSYTCAVRYTGNSNWQLQNLTTDP